MHLVVPFFSFAVLPLFLPSEKKHHETCDERARERSSLVSLDCFFQCPREGFQIQSRGRCAHRPKENERNEQKSENSSSRAFLDAT